MNKNLMPKGSTLEEFFDSSGKLFLAEQKLLVACRDGTGAIISTTRPDKATADNTVRAEFIRFLALQTDSAAPIHAKGIQLSGAYITAALDLQDCSVVLPIALICSRFEQILYLVNASLHDFNLEGSAIPGLIGHGMKCSNNFFLYNKFSAHGEIRLSRAKIGGDFACADVTMENPSGDALCADGAEINGSVFLRAPFCARGQIRLLGAKIGGNLECDGAKLENPGGYALNADGAEICGDVFLRGQFSAQGEISLQGTKIGGNLECSTAKLENPGSDALNADNSEINGSVFLRASFSAQGKIRLLGAKIGNNLECTGVKLENPSGDALSADGAEINGGMFLMSPFSAKGHIRLLGAKIGGNLACVGAMLENPDGNALSADHAEIRGNVFLNSQFSSKGKIRLLSAKIGGDFQCFDATLESADDTALSADGMQVKGVFRFTKVSNSSLGINLINCEVHTLVDDPDSWPEGLTLDGFTYQRLAGSAPVDAKSRIAWLKKQNTDDLTKDFKPHPWTQLASVLRKEGHTSAAREVAVEAQHLRRRAGQLGAWWNPRRWLHIAYGGLIGFGYRPLKTVGWMLAAWLVCSGIYWYSAEQDVFAPSNPLVFHHHNYEHCQPDYKPTQYDKENKRVTNNWTKCDALRGEHTTFSPMSYSLDVILPLVDLQQEKDWGQYIDSRPFSDQPLNFLTRWVMWFEILFGWVCSLLLVATLSGLTKSDKD